MPEHAETQPAASRVTGAPALDAATATALLQHSACAIALCDAQGASTGATACCSSCRAVRRPKGGARTWRCCSALSSDDAQRLEQALREGRSCQLPDMRVGGHGGSWWRAQISVLPDGRRAVHWSSVDELQHQSAEAGRLAELLDLAQDFGRLACGSVTRIRCRAAGTATCTASGAWPKATARRTSISRRNRSWPRTGPA